MSGRIVADLAAMEEGEQAFATVLRTLRKVLADLDSETAGSLVEWDGDAEAAYRAAHAAWCSAADDMAERLDGLRKVIGVGHRNYRRSLSANVTMWQGG
jgi:WXG100 family type VII secretion target